MQHVYLIQIKETNIYKIGITRKEPERRLQELQTGNPHTLILIDHHPSSCADILEGLLHKRFAANKWIGEERLMGEWFCFDRINIREECQKLEPYAMMLMEQRELDEKAQKRILKGTKKL